ncbi:hypothetical protein [Nocardioides sp.]|uniref:hypothetical protein n=1 Tax=Nocardioides sp. TaxID=35761 RepID=UPI002ED236BC
MTVTTAGSGRQSTELRTAAVPALRTLGTVTLIGIACGILVVGVLSRLAMFVLIELNPTVVGMTSDDGFEMGRFTLSGSLNLALLAGPGFGILGAGFYLALRGLAVGPPWFRMLSLSVGAGVVVGSMIIHADGVDFTMLDPLWLAVLLFVLVPTVFVVLLRFLAERALAGAPWPRTLAYLGVVAWLPLLPGFLLLAAGWAALNGLRRSESGARLLSHPLPAWIARGALAALFVASVLDIVEDVRLIT